MSGYLELSGSRPWADPGRPGPHPGRTPGASRPTLRPRLNHPENQPSRPARTRTDCFMTHRTSENGAALNTNNRLFWKPLPQAV